MKGPASIMILVGAVGLVTGWLFGYHEGQQTGALRESYTLDLKYRMDMDRDQVCDEIRRYKIEMARDLDENTQICGYADMDAADNSN